MMTKQAQIEREQSAIEYNITQRLMNMEDVRIDSGRVIGPQEVFDEMYTLDPDRMVLAVYLCAQQRKGQIEQGQGILVDLRKEAITSLLIKHRHNLYSRARRVVEGMAEMEVPHAVA